MCIYDVCATRVNETENIKSIEFPIENVCAKCYCSIYNFDFFLILNSSSSFVPNYSEFQFHFQFNDK